MSTQHDPSDSSTHPATRARRHGSIVLASLGLLSVLGGVVLWFALPAPFWRAASLQCVVWGAINAGLAVKGLFDCRRDALAPVTHQQSQGDKLLDYLKVSFKMNLAWLSIGIALLAWGLLTPPGDGRQSLLGHGAGMGAQTLQLMLFDRWMAGRLREAA
jgi:hypothetical protein